MMIKWRTGRNSSLKQAIQILLESEQVLIDNGSPDSHGEKRYLEKVLLKGAGALRKTGSGERVNYFSCDTDPSRFSDNFPLLKELCSRLGGLAPEASFPLGTFLEEMKDDPYGVGGNALMLGDCSRYQRIRRTIAFLP